MLKKQALAVLACLLATGAMIAEEAYRGEWILVQLSAPLERRAPDGSFSLETGRAGLDAAIKAGGIHRIEHALEAVRQARNPAALKRYGFDRVYKFHVPAGSDIGGQIARFAALPGVTLAEPDFIDHLSGGVVPNDPLFPLQWAFDQPSDADVDGPEGWAISTGEPILISILDSGIDTDHEEFVGKLVPGYDFANNDADPFDDFGHGTSVSSVAAANTNNSAGIAGTCWGCRIQSIKVANQSGSGTVAWFIDGMLFATDSGADVINHSGGGGGHSNLRLMSVQYARDAGVVMVAASGNGGAIPFPAKYHEFIAAGASNDIDEKAGQSSYGTYQDVLAPGEDVLVANVDAPYGTNGGTSFSAPLVAGLAALVLSVHPTAGREEVKELIHAGADDLVGNPADDIPGWDPYHGWGRVNLFSTLAGAQAAPTLMLQGALATRVLYQTANPLADSYDFVRGDLDALTGIDGRIDLGTVVCLENNSTDPDTLGDEDSGVPAPGQAFFYLGRFNYGPWPGSYGGSSRNFDRLTAETPTGADWHVELTPVESNAELGRQVGSAGDVNNDGFDDVIVAARNFPASPGTGAAFVYHGSASGLATTPAWTVTSNQDNSRFGFAADGAGDVNNDPYDDVIVGEHEYNGTAGPDAGRAHVFLGSASGVQLSAQVILNGPQANAKFGHEARSAGDVNNDSFDDVIVSADLHDGGQLDEGKAYVYRGSALGILTTPIWTFESDQAGAILGAVASAGDVNNDGFDDVIVGAEAYDGVDAGQGRAWVFHGSASGLGAAPAATLEVGGVDSAFGVSVASAGDLNDDGFDDVVVAASRYTNGQTDEGGAFVYYGSASGVSTTPDWTFETGQALAEVESARSAGDVNGDGIDDLIVGSPWYHLTLLNEGAAWLFLGSGSGPSSTPFWVDYGWKEDTAFGRCVDGAGDVDNDGHADLIVGGLYFDNGGINEGSVRVYHGSNASISTTVGAPCDSP